MEVFLILRIQPTYEELKRNKAAIGQFDKASIQPTYEELKLCAALYLVLDVLRIQPTYEELKQEIRYRFSNCIPVSSLPMRN